MLADEAKAAGFDSIQITSHRDQRCGLTHMEVIDVRSDGTQTCGLAYTSGWRGKLPCACDSSLPYANCQHNDFGALLVHFGERDSKASNAPVAKDAFWSAAHPKRANEAADWAKLHPKKAAEAQKEFDRAGGAVDQSAENNG